MFSHPSIEIFVACSFEVGFACNLNIVAGLHNVYTIEKRDEPQAFEGDSQFFINKVKNLGRNRLGGSGDGEIIHLAEEENPGVINNPRVQAWLMYRRTESDRTKDAVSVLFP